MEVILKTKETLMTQKIKCPIDLTMEVIGNKWSIWILWLLSEKTHRYGELKKHIPNITEKMLIQTLKNLENLRVVNRLEHEGNSLKVEYSLTERGSEIVPLLKLIKAWGEDHLKYL